MTGRIPLVLAIAAALSLPAIVDATAAAARKKTQITVTKKRGVGFLPGYRTPEELRRIESRPRYWRHGGLYYFGRPGFHHGRWNGGSYGPCWTSTPIGMMWNCGQ